MKFNIDAINEMLKAYYDGGPGMGRIIWNVSDEDFVFNGTSIEPGHGIDAKEFPNEAAALIGWLHVKGFKQLPVISEKAINE